MNNDTDIATSPQPSDGTRFVATLGPSATLWDPRGDMNDDGASTVLGDYSPFLNAANTWYETTPTVSQAFSDLDNPFMFQGRPHFAIDTADDAEHDDVMLLLNDHRARMNDPVIGRWLTRDPISHADGPNLYRSLWNNPQSSLDPNGNLVIAIHGWDVIGTGGRKEVRRLSYRVLDAINTWRTQEGYAPDPGGQELFNGTGARKVGDLADSISAWADRVKNWKRSDGCHCQDSTPEGVVVFGYSDGATTIYKLFASGRIRATSRYRPLSFVGIIDMVRTNTDLPPNPLISDADRRLPLLSTSYLARESMNYFQSADSWLWPPCPFGAGLWKGYIRSGFKGRSGRVHPANHCSIIDAPVLHDHLIRRALDAYKDAMNLQRLDNENCWDDET